MCMVNKKTIGRFLMPNVLQEMFKNCLKCLKRRQIFTDSTKLYEERRFNKVLNYITDH